MFEGIVIEMADHPQAILDAMASRRREIMRAERTARILNWALVLLGIMTLLVAAGVYFLLESTLAACIVAAVPMVVILILFARVNSRPANVKKQLEEAYTLLHGLRDDTGRKGWVVGTIDLTGARQQSKLARSARNATGKKKEYFRDPWFRANVKLVDGNRLRITITEKVKVKAGAEVGRITVAKTKLLVNPEVYRATTSPKGEAGIIVGEYALDQSSSRMAGLLMELKRTYMQLKPIHPKPAMGVTS